MLLAGAGQGENLLTTAYFTVRLFHFVLNLFELSILVVSGFSLWCGFVSVEVNKGAASSACRFMRFIGKCVHRGSAPIWPKGGNVLLHPPIGVVGPSARSRLGIVSWWSARRFGTKVVLLVTSGFVLWTMWAKFGFTSWLMLAAAVGILFLIVRARPFGLLSWSAVVALSVFLLGGGLSYTSVNPSNRTASTTHRSAQTAPHPAVPSDLSGDQVSKIVINGNSYSATGGREIIPLVSVSKSAPHKVEVPVQIFVTGRDGKPRSGVLVSISNQSGKTEADGSFTAQKVVFENRTSAISGDSSLDIKVGSGQPTSVEVWALNALDGSVGQPALTKEQAMAMLGNPQFVASLSTTCPGVQISDIVGVEQTRSAGQGMVAIGQNGQLVDSSDQIPKDQPIWSFKLAAGKSCAGQPAGAVTVNPVCQNITGKVPGNSPPSVAVPTAPPSGPTLVVTPTPTSPPTVASAPTKNPANGPVQTFATPPPNYPSAPTYTPPPPTGNITAASVSCDHAGGNGSYGHTSIISPSNGHFSQSFNVLVPPSGKITYTVTFYASGGSAGKQNTTRDVTIN